MPRDDGDRQRPTPAQLGDETRWMAAVVELVALAVSVAFAVLRPW